MNKTDEDRAKYCLNPIFGTDLSKPTSDCIEQLRRSISQARGQLTDIMNGKGWEDRLQHVGGLLTCGLVALHNAMEEIYEYEKKQLDHELGPSLSFRSRGIGLDQVPCCFVCGAERRNEEANHYLHNIAAHVGKEDFNGVVNLFGQCARMDYYHGDREAPQIKIGACDKHLPNLQHLHDLTSYYGHIREADVKAAIEYKEGDPK